MKTLGLVDGAVNGKFTPAKGNLLTIHVHEELVSGDFDYSCVVRVLLYLAGHKHLGINYAVNFAVRYIFCPKLVHEYALEQISCYLKATSDKGLIMKPSEKLLKIDSFPDADFVAIYGNEIMNDPVCVKSRNGFVIKVAYYLIMWQSETALSTMEAEIVALSHGGLSCLLLWM